MSLESASKTALMVAAYRARATRQDKAICDDPWAEAIAGEEGHAIAKALDAVFPAMELWVAVRTAYLDAQVDRWTSPPESFAQVVILGAGFDTRAARLARPGVRFFEVDHPATQQRKRERLAELPRYPLDAATRAPCDFEKDDFLDVLARVGFDATAPALLLWEGVAPYLPEAAVRKTLHRIAAGCDARSVLLFDHLSKLKQDKVEPSHRYVAELGEKVLWGTNDPLPMLVEEGFRQVRSLSFDEACLSLTGTYERAREFRFQRIVIASRTSRLLSPV